MPSVTSLTTLDELRQHVHATLCNRDQLDPATAPLRENLILRGGKPCGLFFESRGPRLLKTFAIWSCAENRVLFYDSTGARFGETRLIDSPAPEALAALV
jgi:hypothetical protein